MIDTVALAARRHSEVHPGYQLIAAVEAAIPFSLLGLEAVVQERKELPLVDEFVLRLCNQDVDTIAEIAGVLGMDEHVVRDSVARHLSADTLDYRINPRGERVVSLTLTGHRAVAELQTTVPRRIDLDFTFDLLLRAPSPRQRSELIVGSDVTDRGMVRLPPASTHDVAAHEVTPRMLNRLIEDSRRAGQAHPLYSRRTVGTNGSTVSEILSVDAVTRQKRRYLPAVLLVHAAAEFDEVRLTIVVDDDASPDHEHALTDIGGADKLGIIVQPPQGEPDLPEHLRARRTPHETVRGLQRRADATSADDPDATPSENEDSLTARAELDALPVRSVPVFEHRELLTHALQHARRRFLLLTSSVRDAVVTDSLIDQLETMLRQPGITAHIGYGLMTPSRDHEDRAVKRLQLLASRHENLTLAHVDQPHPHALIFDDTWVNSSFDWLGHRGGPLVFRREEGTLIHADQAVHDRHTEHADLITSVASAAEAKVPRDRRHR